MHPSAAETSTSSIEDLGPANASMFPLMSGLQVGDLLFIGSRNLTPSQVIGYHLPTRRVIRRHRLGPGKFVQALAASPDGSTLYGGVVGAGSEPNLYAIEIHDPVDVGSRDCPARPVATFPGLDGRALSVAPDGVVFAVGKQDPPSLWEFRPASGEVRQLAVPDPKATQARGVAATDRTVYFGSGSNLGGGGGASRSDVFAVDRKSGQVTSIQPSALDDDPAVRQLALAGDRLLVGTQGRGGIGHLSVIPLESPERAEVHRFPGKSVGCFHVTDEAVFFGAHGVYRYDRSTGTIEEIPGVDVTERWALGYFRSADDEAELINLSSFGAVQHVRPSTGRTETVDLLEAGAPAQPQLGMSLAVDDDRVYVGGNGGVVRHDLRTGAVARLPVPGEAKSMDVVSGALLMAVYNSQGIWRAVDGAARKVATLPPEQNRPQDTAWDADRGLLLIGSQNDTEGGGSLALFDPETVSVELIVNPIDELQMVRAVAVTTDRWYLGGWSRYRNGSPGEIVALDPATRSEQWRLDPQLGAGLSCLGVLGNTVVGVTMNGRLVAVDRHQGKPIADRDVTGLTPGMSQLVRVGDRLFVGTEHAVFAVDQDLGIEVITDRLDGAWYSGPKIAADRQGRLYTLRGRHLVRITPVRSGRHE